MRWLWPVQTGKTLFDVWWVVHLCWWVVVGSALQPLGVTMKSALTAMLLVAGAWEVFERFAEKKWPMIWKHQEAPINSYLGDIVFAGGLGVWLGYFLAASQ